MEILIQPRNIRVNDHTRAYIQKRFAPLGRRLRGIGETKVEIRREPTRSTQHQVIVQVTANVNGTLLRAEERAATVNAAVDVVANALDRQVMKYKGRRLKNLKGKGGQRESIRVQPREAEAAAEDAEEPIAAVLPTGRVIRVKRFPVRGMGVEEAVVQMELLGHNFFLFLNGATQQYNVLYRRNDGDYAVIEPELSDG
ncbi:MAG: ribosome-associated translation inhibitor RaiA [Chloroflexi bacterium]|nr:ribosome-associated translation inhibitor RaiA [Chloroflexota bacterium]